MTSLFSRLQKLNKEATPPEWRQYGWNVVHSETGRLTGTPEKEEDAALIVECRNSLPAVLNLIEAAQWATSHISRGAPPTRAEAALMKAVAVFVSGQEEPNG